MVARTEEAAWAPVRAAGRGAGGDAAWETLGPLPKGRPASPFRSSLCRSPGLLSEHRRSQPMPTWSPAPRMTPSEPAVTPPGGTWQKDEKAAFFLVDFQPDNVGESNLGFLHTDFF